MGNKIKMLPRYEVLQENEKNKKRIRKTTEQYKSELLIKNPNIEVIDEYVNAKTSILHKCKRHNIIYKATPTNVLKGCGCKECGKEKIVLKNTKSLEQYKKELYEVNPYITPIGEYTNCETPLEHICLLCNNTFTVLPRTILYKEAKGCPTCRMDEALNKTRFTIEKYKELVKKIHSNIEVLSDFYINNSTPLKHRCKICNHIFESIPANILKGHGCKKCAIKNLSNINSKTNEEFLYELYNKNPHATNIVILSKYTGSHDNIKCFCKVCENTWSSLATNLLKGSGCPNCKSSYGEFSISNYLKNNHIVFSKQKKFENLRGVNNGLLSYDFYIPKYNILVEFQGEQHKKPIEYFGGQEQFLKQQEHDRRKREYAKTYNINLLEIWYYDIDNIEEILTKTLNNLKLECVETATST